MARLIIQPVGYIGLGNLGVHLAGSLLRAGFPLTVYDLNQDTADQLLAAGARWAESAQTVAAQSDSIFTCLPSSKAVATVVEGEQGILAELKPGATWIDTSTNERT